MFENVPLTDALELGRPLHQLPPGVQPLRLARGAPRSVSEVLRDASVSMDAEDARDERVAVLAAGRRPYRKSLLNRWLGRI